MVKTKQMQNVVVVNGVISPGTILSQDNLRVAKVEKQRLRSSTFADIESVLGARMKRRIRDGQPISPNQLCYICKGDSIVITADIGGLYVKTSGIAQQDGNIGDTILVRNSQSKKIIDAVVKSANLVAVNI
jgi:flagella basal body P-ring formation protein FlgA